MKTPENSEPRLITESPIEAFARFRQAGLFKHGLRLLKKAGLADRLLELQEDVKAPYSLTRHLIGKLTVVGFKSADLLCR